MSPVVADTSSLQYLHQLGHLTLLDQLLGPISIPQAVADELAEGRRIGVNVPDPADFAWITVASVRGAAVLPLAWDLGRGEREVLALALEQPGTLVVLDDGPARRGARHLGIAVIGTLGVLLKAKQAGLLAAVGPLLDELDRLKFRVDADTRRHVLHLAGE